MDAIKDGLSERKDITGTQKENKRDGQNQVPPKHKKQKVKVGGRTCTIK